MNIIVTNEKETSPSRVNRISSSNISAKIFPSKSSSSGEDIAYDNNEKLDLLPFELKLKQISQLNTREFTENT